MKFFKYLTILLLITLNLPLAKAQSEEESDVEDILKVGLNDAEILAQNYFRPLFDGFGFGFANGWYNTAKPHKSLGFDFTISTNFVQVPQNMRYFTIREEDYNSITLANSSENTTPTMFGPDEEGPEMNYSFTDPETGINFTGSFNGWAGMGLKENIGFDRVPAPTIQLGVGVIKNTDLIIRYIPNIRVGLDDGENNTNMLGLGIKHDIGQWVKAIDKLPIDIALFGAFSGLNNTYVFDETAQVEKSARFDVDNWTAQLLVSKKISILTVYGGFGYTSVNSKFKLSGEYELEDENSGAVLTYTDPINFSYTNSTFKGTLGLRLKFGVFTMHGDYTIQEYNVISAGIGFAFR